MKKVFITCIIAIYSFSYAQPVPGIMLNPYLDYKIRTTPYNVAPYYENVNSDEIYSTWHNQSTSWGSYAGEYEINIDDLFGGMQFFDALNHPIAITYDYEVVGFPFMMNCFDQTNSCADCGNLTRFLGMPDASHTYANNKWGDYLYRVSQEGYFRTDGFSEIDNSGGNPPHRHQNLVSWHFTSNYTMTSSYIGNDVLPHSAHKINLYLHCDNSVTSDVIQTLSFIYDNTRGRMRYYPFYTDNCANLSSVINHDVIFRPAMIVPPNLILYYNDTESNDDWTDGIGTVNQFKYDEIDNNGCSTYPIPLLNTDFSDNPGNFFNPYPSPSSLFVNYLYQNVGATLAGYAKPILPNTALAYANPSQDTGKTKHHYKIDREIDLTIINPSEKIIYNPSEVEIEPATGLSFIDVHFPSGYTFKTIRGTFANIDEVDDDNLGENGGPWNDKRLVPVTTDLRSENSGDPHDPSVIDDAVYASRYYLNSGSQLTVEPCLRIFDATFDVYEGATMVFEDYDQILGLEDKSSQPGRYKVQCFGGAVLRNLTDIQYVQNGNITQTQPLHYKAQDQIIAGYDYDPNTEQVAGNYDIQSGADVVFKAGNIIRLKDGFRAHEGCSFRAYCGTIPIHSVCPSWSDIDDERLAKNNSITHSIEKLILITPNPSRGIFQVFYPDRKLISGILSVCDMMGNQVYQKQNTETAGINIDLSARPKGVYTVKLTEGENVSVNKIVLQ